MNQQTTNNFLYFYEFTGNKLCIFVYILLLVNCCCITLVLLADDFVNIGVDKGAERRRKKKKKKKQSDVNVFNNNN